MPRLNSLSGHLANAVTFGVIETGYLSCVNGVLHIQTMQTVTDADGKESRQAVPVEFADFDIRAESVVHEEKGKTWIVQIRRRGSTDPIHDQVTSDTLASVPRLETWLASHAVSFGEPTTGSVMHKFKPGTRIMRYLQAQQPTVAVIKQQLGYHDDLNMFLTPKGAILPGAIDFDEDLPYFPAAKLTRNGPSPFTFNFANQGLEEVREVLREVLTFHDETATALFSSWAVMSLIQSALVEKYTDHFPVFAVEAPSGTGKTTGALGLLAQLITGYSLGESQSTPAALRDLIASTWSGFVHIDDVDDPTKLFELMRLSTAKGKKPKKAGQHWDQNDMIQLTGSMYITGEQLGMNNEKALLDRVIKIGLPSPVDRKSQRPGREHMSQSRDIKEMQRRYRKEWGGLAALSATLISEVLLYVHELCDLVDTLRPSTGRAGDKYAVLLAGARMVDRLLGEEGAWAGEGMTSFRVARWVEHQLEDTTFDGDNKLTLRVIPDVFGLDIPVPDKFKGVPVPFPPCGIAEISGFEGERLFIQMTILSNVWEAWKGVHNVDLRTESRSALEQQAKAAGFVPSGKAVRLRGRGDLNPQRLWVAPLHVTEAVRSRLKQ